MRLKLFIVSVLRFFVLTDQEEGDQSWATLGSDFDLTLFNDMLNGTLPTTEGESSAPCSKTVYGLSSLGLMITFITVFVFSMLGNSVVVYVVCYMKKGRASTDVYLMHLALADLLFSITLPFWAVKIHSGWIFGKFLCKLLSGLQEASVYSGVFLLACISVDRYFAIVKATRVLSSRSHLVGLVCSMVWLVAGVLSLPVAIQRDTLETENMEGHILCYENLTGESSDRWRVSVRVLRHTMGFFLPLVVMVFCYGCTMVTLFHSRNQQKHKAMRVILAVVLAFVLCWLPHNITVLIDTLMRGRSLGIETCDVRNRVDLVLHVTQVMAFMHCAVNPVLYAFIGQKFRNQLLAALHKRGLISKRLQVAYRKGSANSTGSFRSRNTSVTL
uniref:C-X-C chemokine receptor type 1 n=1 Tax=Centroberyx gerrardi TaxID=166262 RepID=UPI003AAF29B8